MSASYPAIHLYREGNHVVVKIEVGFQWVEVIRELIDGSFSHIVEPSGIAAAIARLANQPEKETE